MKPDGEFSDVDDLLAAARARLERLSVTEAAAALAEGALLVDIRPAWQRMRDGEVAGALVVERNHLEWRLHPRSASRLPQARPGQRWIVVCAEGYTSSLAAASLCAIGVLATDLVGGIRAWRAAGLPVVPGPSQVERVVGAPGTETGPDAGLTPPPSRPAEHASRLDEHASRPAEHASSEQPGPDERA